MDAPGPLRSRFGVCLTVDARKLHVPEGYPSIHGAMALLAPYLTPQTTDELLAAATRKRRPEIEQLLAARFPRPDVPTQVPPVGRGGRAWAMLGARATPRAIGGEPAMMFARPRLRGLVALSLLAATGCTTIREIPRDGYDAAPERHHVVVVTRDGSRQEFDDARVAGDSLTGYIERDNQSGIPEYRSVVIALDDIEHLSAKRVDWYRTALAGGVSLGAVVAVALSRHKGAAVTPPDITPPCSDPPCPP